MSTAEEVFNAALTLPEEERVELVEALIASLQPGNRPPFDESWREVIRRRSTELRSGAVQPTPWAEVKHAVWGAPESDGMLDAWTELPSPSGGARVKSGPGKLTLPDAPDLPTDEKDAS